MKNRVLGEVSTPIPTCQIPLSTSHFLTSYTYASDLRPPKFSDQMMKSTGEWQLKSCCYSRINSPQRAFILTDEEPQFLRNFQQNNGHKTFHCVCFELYFRPENCGDGHTICHHDYFSRGSHAHVQSVFYLIPK